MIVWASHDFSVHVNKVFFVIPRSHFLNSPLKYCSLFSRTFLVCSSQFVVLFCFLFHTYHSLKFDDSVLWLLVWCTAVAAGDMELLLWFSVDGDTMVGGVDDSYPELAAGDGCDPGLVDSWTFSKEQKVREGKKKIKV